MKYLLVVISAVLLVSCFEDKDDIITIKKEENNLVGRFANIDAVCLQDYYDCESKMKLDGDSLTLTFAKNKYDVPQKAKFKDTDEEIILEFGKDYPTDFIFKKVSDTELLLKKDNTTWLKNDTNEYVYTIPDCGKGNGKEECAISTCEFLNATDVEVYMDIKNDSPLVKSTYTITNDTVITIKKQDGLSDGLEFYFRGALGIYRPSDKTTWTRLEKMLD